jgi:hypothetical protein
VLVYILACIEAQYLQDVFGFAKSTSSATSVAHEDKIVYESSDEELLRQSTSGEEEVLYDTSDEGLEVIENNRTYAKNRRTTYSLQFLGRPVCTKAYSKLLGIGDSTLEKVRDGIPAFTNSSRPARPKHPVLGFVLDVPGKWQSVLMFCWMLYMSCAECLPTHFDMPRTQGANGAESDPDFGLRSINAYMNNLHRYCSDPQNNQMGPGTFTGSKRFLHHSTRTELMWEYRAYCDANNIDPASRTVFFQVINKVIGSRKNEKSHLGLRKPNEHGKCDTCYALKKAIQEGRSSQERTFAYRKYSAHILSQWLDRQVYWSLRSLSFAYFRQSMEFGRRQGLYYWPDLSRLLLQVVL